MNPRRAGLVGIIFIVIAGFYWLAPTVLNGIVDYAGITMLLALGVAMSVMAYVLFAGLQRS